MGFPSPRTTPGVTQAVGYCCKAKRYSSQATKQVHLTFIPQPYRILQSDHDHFNLTQVVRQEFLFLPTPLLDETRGTPESSQPRLSSMVHGPETLVNQSPPRTAKTLRPDRPTSISITTIGNFYFSPQDNNRTATALNKDRRGRGRSEKWWWVVDKADIDAQSRLFGARKGTGHDRLTQLKRRAGILWNYARSIEPPPCDLRSSRDDGVGNHGVCR